MIDAAKTAAALSEMLAKRERTAVALPLIKVDPKTPAAAVDNALAEAKTLLAGAITLVGELPPDAIEREPKDEDPITTASIVFEPKLLAEALRSNAADGAVTITLDAATIETGLEVARKKLERPPVDATFDVNKRDEVSVVPARPGRVIDVDNVVTALLAATKTDAREAPFPIEVGAQPELSTAGAEALKIAGLVSKFTTVHPCCRPRVKNIHRMAELIDGVVLKPGEKFSINEHVGERRRANGFYPAPTIVHGEMKDTVGGGVSQFATTFFNAAFYGAYEIIERQPHSFYFDRYPMGHEATLSFPKPDVIIRNDTEAGLLIRCIARPTSITVKFYGDNGGRKVKRKKSGVFAVTQPPVEYIPEPKFKPDREKVKEQGKVGWSLNVSRIITMPDGTTKKQSRKVTYQPRVRKLRVHPCKIPRSADNYTGQKCPEPEDDDDDDDGADNEVSDAIVEDTPGVEVNDEPEEDPEDS